MSDVVNCLLCDSLVSTNFDTRICSTCKEQNPTVFDPGDFAKINNLTRRTMFDPYPFTVIESRPDGTLTYGEKLGWFSPPSGPVKRFTCCGYRLPNHAQDCPNDPEYIAECVNIEEVIYTFTCDCGGEVLGIDNITGLARTLAARNRPQRTPEEQLLWDIFSNEHEQDD